MFEVRLPARMNILGNPSDANEGAHQTISAAVNLWGGVEVGEGERLRMALTEEEGKGREIDSLEAKSFQDLEYGTGFDLQTAAIRTLWSYSPEFRDKASENLPVMRFWTEIPRQSGLGGSTVLVLLTLVALARYYRLDRKKHNDYVLGELAQRAEEKELDITCGFADRYVPLFGDIAYLDYRGKLFHAPIKDEPYCTYEKLGRWVDTFPLVMCSTGVPHDSGDVHRPMRAKYLEEYKEFKGDYENGPFMVRIMKQIGDTAWKGKIALLEGDLSRFGELMNLNHKLVDEMMRYCGFTEGAGEANNRMIEAGLKAGVLGAKLTGAGGGGSVFMLVEPGKEGKMAGVLSDALKSYGYDQGRVFVPSIVRQGGTIIDKKKR
jgi:galactokinase/mevalonate kinase-like predicted kinase